MNFILVSKTAFRMPKFLQVDLLTAEILTLTLMCPAGRFNILSDFLNFRKDIIL